MRVLLINSNRFKQPWPVMPFGLCCVASAAEAAGHEVRVLDLCFSSRPERDIRKAVAEFRPGAAGVSIRNLDNSAGYNTLFLLDEVRDAVIAPIKRAFSGSIVIGGPAVGLNGAEMLEYFGLEYALRGDGEAAFVEFLRRLEAGESPAGLGSLVWRLGGRIVEDNPPLVVADLDSLPAATALITASRAAPGGCASRGRLPRRSPSWFARRASIRSSSPTALSTSRWSTARRCCGR